MFASGDNEWLVMALTTKAFNTKQSIIELQNQKNVYWEIMAVVNNEIIVNFLLTLV